MRGRTAHKLHKWIAVVAGAFFLMWLLSGIVMVLPRPWSVRIQRRAPEPIEVHERILSPSEVVTRIARDQGTEPTIESLTLRRAADTVVYEVKTRENTFLVDAHTAERFTITAEVAKRIVQYHYPAQSSVFETSYLDRHTAAYPWGPLPVYRVMYGEEPTTHYYVSAGDGVVTRSDRWNRFQGVFGALHSFEPLRLITSRDAIRRWLLVLAGLGGIGVALSGYYLAVPRRRRRLLPGVAGDQSSQE